jgi:hypothetical protein
MRIEEYLIKGFKQRYGDKTPEFVPDSRNPLVITNYKADNFIGPPMPHEKHKGFAYWELGNACKRYKLDDGSPKYTLEDGSLRSSQAFAYNIFSNVPGVEFEVKLRSVNRPAQVDVMLAKDSTANLFEVKALEFLDSNKIDFSETYDHACNYRTEYAQQHMEFIKRIKSRFNEDTEIYGYGVKQLCCHLLGILQEMNNGELKNFSTIKLYSLCLDEEFSHQFAVRLKKYRETLEAFGELVREYLREIEQDHRIEYCGYIGASDYIREHKVLIGEKNYEYVKNRYFYVKQLL